jgi:ATP-dependent Clp protease ATP-binding subunit ClpC
MATGSTANNFTPRAQMALALATKESRNLRYSQVGTGGLLLGLLALGQGASETVLKKLGFNLEYTRKEVEKVAVLDATQALPEKLAYSPRCRRVLGAAVKEAKALNHTFVGTEHILLALLAEGDGPAARVLQNLKIDAGEVRREMLNELGPK